MKALIEYNHKLEFVLPCHALNSNSIVHENKRERLNLSFDSTRKTEWVEIKQVDLLLLRSEKGDLTKGKSFQDKKLDHLFVSFLSSICVGKTSRVDEKTK